MCVLQACTGIMVALVVKYTDVIHKSFAACASVILSELVEITIYKDFTADMSFISGSFIVCIATLMFAVLSSRVDKHVPFDMLSMVYSPKGVAGSILPRGDFFKTSGGEQSNGGGGGGGGEQDVNMLYIPVRGQEADDDQVASPHEL